MELLTNPEFSVQFFPFNALSTRDGVCRMYEYLPISKTTFSMRMNKQEPAAHLL